MVDIKQTLEILNSDDIQSVLSTEAANLLTALSVFETVSSTNTYLLECAKSGAPSGSVCLADQQTQGRGRQGRIWYSPPGANIYCSWLWHFSLEALDLSALSLALGVMVVNCLKRWGVTSDIQLKWPNDVLAQGRKLAGILVESVPLPHGGLGVVVGIGLNVCLPAEFPQAADWIDVFALTNQPVQRNVLAGLLIDEVLLGLLRFQEKGFADFLLAWSTLDVLRDKVITVNAGGTVHSGLMCGINRKGELLLEKNAEIMAFRCGEVSVRINE